MDNKNVIFLGNTYIGFQSKRNVSGYLHKINFKLTYIKDNKVVISQLAEISISTSCELNLIR